MGGRSFGMKSVDQFARERGVHERHLAVGQKKIIVK